MRFQRSLIRYNVRPLTKQRLSAARRALERQAAAMPLFADQIRTQQPTPEERIAQIDAGVRRYIESLRSHDAESWKRGRAALRKLAPERKAELLRLWNAMKVPAHPHYFLDFLHTNGVNVRQPAPGDDDDEKLAA